MKIKMSLLKKIIKESVLLEKEDMTRSSGRAIAASKITAKDNPNALMVNKNESDRVQTALKVKNRGMFYYVWSGAKEAGISGAPLYMLGSLTNGNGDPYTYEKVPGNKYRVISGPKSSTIGKTFTLDPAPAVTTPPLPSPAPSPEPSPAPAEQTDVVARSPDEPQTGANSRKKELFKIINEMNRELGPMKAPVRTQVQLIADKVNNNKMSIDDAIQALIAISRSKLNDEFTERLAALQ